MGNLDRAMLGGNHVEGKPGLVGLPTIYHWKLIKDQVFPGLQLTNNRFPGPRSLYVEGGIHLTANSFLPEALLKELTATEDQFYSGFVNTRRLFSLSLGELDEEQAKLYKLENMRCWKDLTVPVEDCKEVINDYHQNLSHHQRWSPSIIRWFHQCTYPGICLATESGILTGLERVTRGTGTCCKLSQLWFAPLMRFLKSILWHLQWRGCSPQRGSLTPRTRQAASHLLTYKIHLLWNNREVVKKTWCYERSNKIK